MTATDNVSAQLAGKYLTVVLDNEAYGIAVGKVRGIISLLGFVGILPGGIGADRAFTTHRWVGS